MNATSTSPPASSARSSPRSGSQQPPARHHEPKSTRRLITIALATVVLIGASVPQTVSAGGNDLTQQKLHGRWTESSPASYYFGYSVALSAKYALVGGYNAFDIGPSQGSVQVYDAVTGAWQRKLSRPGPPVFGGQFGAIVAVSGNLAVVGASGATTNKGKAYVYDLTNGKLKATLESPDTSAGDYFGLTVAIRGNLVAVGAPYHNTRKGAVYLYQATTGLPLGKIEDASAMTDDHFGMGTAIEGNILAVGMPGADNDTGALFLYDLSTYAQITRFTPATAAPDDKVGSFISMQGGRVALCTARDNGGKVFLYNIPTSTYETLVPADPFAGNYFGYCAAVDGNRVLVGGFSSFIDHGQVYVFDATTGEELDKFSAQDSFDGDGFGRSVSLCGNTALVGRFHDKDQGGSVGAGYLVRSIITPMPLDKVAARGDFTPGAPECKYGTLGDAFINNNGETAFISTLAGPGSHGGKDSAGMSDLFNLGTLSLLRKSGQQYNPAAKVGGVSCVILNNPDMVLGRGKLVGAGIPASNQFIWWANSMGAAGTHLRTGATVTEFGNAMPLAFPEMVQSIRANTPRMAVSCTLQQVNGVTADKDSGIWALSTGSAPVAVREGGMIPGTTYASGQFTGRVAFLLDEFVYSLGLTGSGITPQNNTAILQRPTNAAEKVIVQKGATPAGLPGAAFTGFIGELDDGGENVLYRATVAGNGVTPATNEGLWLHMFNGTPKLQLRKGQPIPSIPGVTISRIINYWATAATNSRTVALVRLAGVGVQPSNDQAVVIVEASDTPYVIMREGEPAAGCTPATIGTISRFEFDTWGARYAIICTLAGAPAGTDLALYTGSLSKGNNADKATLRRPFLRLRKGQAYEDQSSRIKSFSLPTTSMTACGAGNTGRGRAISWNGNLAITLEFDNKVRQIMKGSAN